MFNLSLREEWANNKTFCHRLTDYCDDGGDGADGKRAANMDMKAKVGEGSNWKEAPKLLARARSSKCFVV